ncbi:MAG: hypothetical protein HY926_04330 [Elusimicrobia bacterium]|nr:hypothetical protein [Elusimicrobiota bacterium]
MKPKSHIPAAPKIKVTMMLADFAQSIQGKLYIMGGGWSITGPHPCPSALAIKIEVPWNDTNHQHELKVELLDGDYHPVLVPTPAGNAPMVIAANFEVGRPAGMIVGSTLDVPIAFNVGAIPLEPGRRYVWRLLIDGKTEDNWHIAFSTRPSARPPAQPGA